jgi:hypothetical protein
MYYIFCRVSYQSTISIKIKCHRNQKNTAAHAACAAKNSQKKEENALVARRVITKRAMSVTRRSSQAKE